MDYVLVIVRPFGGHTVGDVISDSAQMHQVLTGEHVNDVVRVTTPGKVTNRSQGV